MSILVNPAAVKLGKMDARHDPRTLQLANYLRADLLPHVQPRVDWETVLTNLGLMGNDSLGDCTCAAAGHMIQAWTANNGQQIVVPDADIVKAYSEACGYVPGDPSTDLGGVEIEVLNYWRKTGVGGHKIFGYVSQEPRNRAHVELAVGLLGGCYLGIALPISAQRQRVWSVPAGGPVGEGEPGSWGGHAVPIIGYGPTGPVCITWGTLVTMTWSFFETYCDEAYGILSQDWATDARTAPSGFDFAQLQADLALIAR